MTYLPFVDGLRAVAILAVVAYHALPWALPGGFAGVDVFFVISGFLITRFIAAEMADGIVLACRSSMFAAPAACCRRRSCVFSLSRSCRRLCCCRTPIGISDAACWRRSLMYANIFFYNTGGYFTAPSLEKPLLHTWSLAVEDQFYLTWPLLLVVLAPRLSRQSLAMLCVALLAVSLVFRRTENHQGPRVRIFPAAGACLGTVAWRDAGADGVVDHDAKNSRQWSGHRWRGCHPGEFCVAVARCPFSRLWRVAGMPWHSRDHRGRLEPPNHRHARTRLAACRVRRADIVFAVFVALAADRAAKLLAGKAT